ncbi:hypothetical protein PSAB6_50145 [Paraburkholderia sabiae]|nr:hypothetical protein PSAB6_50145 [Paraburkholderia sabiae]
MSQGLQAQPLFADLVQGGTYPQRRHDQVTVLHARRLPIHAHLSRDG